jgi:CRISPR-associated endonuclease/helicase Cas3
MVRGNLPDVIDIPTGGGKTSVIPIWLLAIAAQSPHPSLPRRLVYVVNRRVVVDQATDIAEQIRKKLPAVPEVRKALGKLSADPTKPLAISTLRGAREDNKEWQADPARPAIIVGTVDMTGSKLMFSGYQSSQKMRPFLAGLIGQDVLLIHDEAHLTPAFGQLIRQIIQTQQKQGNPRPLRMIELSATRRIS